MGDEGVRAIVLKGPSFADWLYTDGTRRRYGDVDLLVSPAQLEQANAVLSRHGFVPHTPGEHPLRDPTAGQPWVRERDDAVIDLHVRLHGVGAPAAIAWTELSADTERQRVGGIKVEVLRPSARALHVALHAAQHGSRASKPIEDLRRALAVLDEDLWHEAAILAAHIQALPAFATGLRHLPEGGVLAARLGAAGRDPAGDHAARGLSDAARARPRRGGARARPGGEAAAARPARRSPRLR